MLLIFLFFCAVLLCVFTFSVPCWYVHYDFCITTMFGSSLPPCLYETSCLIYVICGFYLRIVVSKTYCVVFLFCLSSSCVPYIASFSGLSFLIAPSVFSNVYLSVSLDCPFWLPLRYSLTFIYSFSGLSFLIAPSVFSNVCLL